MLKIDECESEDVIRLEFGELAAEEDKLSMRLAAHSYIHHAGLGCASDYGINCAGGGSHFGDC